MQISEFEANIQAAAPGKVFPLVAPNGLSEYVVWHEYAPRTLTGDDSVELEAPRVQIDVVWQKDRQLLTDIKAALSAMSLPYVVVDYGYDDQWQGMRCILQLEVL